MDEQEIEAILKLLVRQGYVRVFMREEDVMLQLTDKGREYLERLKQRRKQVGRIHPFKGRVEFVPLKNLRIRSSDPAISCFLVPKVLESAKKKNGWNYQIIDRDGLLDRIIIYGDLTAEDIKELSDPFGWAFEDAAERAEKEAKK